MTSLAAQLRHLAVPSTNLFKNDKRRSTLLFDPKEAASISGEVIYEIGLEGLEQLILKDEAFEQFKKTLFSGLSKDFDRNVQSQNDNKKVDKHIKTILALLSPYILTNPAHKALEWLFYRYAVNEFNRNEVIMVVLPYYNSNIFSRIVQTLTFDDANDPFYFLKTVQKFGTHLQRLDLFYQALSNASIIKYITTFMNQVMDVHTNHSVLTVHFNFYCTVFCGAIEFASEVNEPFISQMLPLVLKGLNSSIPDFAAASYVITAKLLSKSNLSTKLLNTFIEKVSDLKCSSLKLEATLMAVLIYQLQKEYDDLPTKAIANFSNSDWVVQCLQYLYSNGNHVYPYLKVLIQKAMYQGIRENQSSCRHLVMKVVNEVDFDSDFIETFVGLLVDAADSQAKDEVEINEWLHVLAQKLESRYSSNLNLVVGTLLKDKNNPPSRKTFLRDIFGSVNKTYATKFKILHDLYDTQGTIEDESLESIAKSINGFNSGDQYLLSNLLCEKLYDQNPKTVECTLRLLSKTELGKSDLLQTNLLELFKKGQLLAKRWQKSYILASKFLIRHQQFNWDIFTCLFPFIALYHNTFFGEIGELFMSDFFSQSKLFLYFDISSYKNSNNFMEHLLTHITKNSSNELLEEFLNSVSSEPQKSCIYHYSAMVILSHMISKNITVKDSLTYRFFKMYSIYEEQSISRESSTLECYLKMALKKKLPLQGIMECLNNIISKTIDAKLKWDTMDLQNSRYSVFLNNICSLAFSNKILTNVFNLFLNHVCSDISLKIRTSLNLCASGLIKEDMIRDALCSIREMFSENTEKSFVVDKYTSLYFLVLYSNPQNEIRNLVFDLTECMLDHKSNEDENYIWFLQELLSYKVEIIADREQIPLIIFNLLAQTEAARNKSLTSCKFILSDLLGTVCLSEVPIYIKAGVLKMLSHISNFEILETLCRHFLELFADKSTFNEYESEILNSLISRLDLGVMSQVSLNTSTWHFITFVLSQKKTLTNTTYLPNVLLNRLSRDFYSVLPEDTLKTFLNIICEIAVLSEDPELLSQCNKIYKHMDLDAKLILTLLVEMAEVQSSKPTSSKKRRARPVPTVDILDTLAWKKGICVLEFIQGKKKIRNGQLLLPLLFDILKKCLEFEEQAAVEYSKQLTLSLILLVCSKLEGADITEKDFNIELVIQCIRASQNPQTHYHALLALAYAARFVPNEVLHHVMAVFTFMGSTLIRQDDTYSFEVISKVIDTIIPILVTESRTTTITDVLRVFVGAILDVPEHRRLPLYLKLLSNFDANANLYLFLLLVFEAEVFQTTAKGKTSERTKIALTICEEFSPELTLHGAVLLAKYLKDLPEENDDSITVTEDNVINISKFSAKQFRHFKYSVTVFLSNLLSARTFVNKISLISDEDSIKLENLYKELIINVLAYIQKVQRRCDKLPNSPQLTYWKTVLHHSYNLLDSVNDLLTTHMFLLVIRGLLAHSLHTVKKRALELLNNKLQYNASVFNEQNKTEVYILIKPILLIIDTVKDDNIQADQEVLIQTALLSLKLIAKVLGPQEPEKFVQILDFVGNILISGHARDNVLASVILCLAELCTILRGHGLSGLTSFMPQFLSIVKKQKYQDTSSMLLMSVITAINKLLDSFSAFLSPYLKKLLCETSILISKWDSSADDPKLQALVSRLHGIKKKIGVVIPPRILIPTIENCYNTLIDKQYYHAIVALISIMEEQLSNLQFNEISKNMSELTSFFLKALQFRCDNNSCTLEIISLVENQVVKTITVFILKLSESTFRPFYLKLFDWAIGAGSNRERLITFYHLSESIGHALKGLFVLFAGNIINNLAEVLSNISSKESENDFFEDKTKTILLLDYVLKTLQTIFTYDSKKIINRDSFELLMQPLVDLLEKDIDGLQSLVKRNESLITPTIVSFSLAISDDALWKQMNYQILLKMRNSHSEIRLAALHCLAEIVSKLKEDFLPLLPETIPFLAELLEDEDERVERFCQKTIREMEKILGEPLQRYF